MAIALGKPEVAVTLLAANDKHSRTHIEPTWPPWVAELEQALAAAKGQLDNRRFAQCWNVGQGMTAEDALELASSELATPSTMRGESL